MKTIKKVALLFGSVGLMIGMVALNSCKKAESLPPIGGFDSADQIGSANLVAYWNFDGNDKETKSNIGADYSLKNTYVTGVKGQALNLSAGLLHYPTIAALNSMPSFTVSAWVKVANNGTSSTTIFSLTRPNEWAGAVNMMVETGWKKAGNDTLNVKALIVPKIGTEATFQDSRNDPSKKGDQAFKCNKDTWFHDVIVWDATTSKLLVYANGKKISNPDWELRMFNNNPIGALSFFTPTEVVIGAVAFNVPSWGKTPESWMVPMTGQIDELRIWNKTLAPEDISSLYQLELAGR
jgi:hypothetical protein